MSEQRLTPEREALIRDNYVAHLHGLAITEDVRALLAELDATRAEAEAAYHRQAERAEAAEAERDRLQAEAAAMRGLVEQYGYSLSGAMSCSGEQGGVWLDRTMADCQEDEAACERVLASDAGKAMLAERDRLRRDLVAEADRAEQLRLDVLRVEAERDRRDAAWAALTETAKRHQCPGAQGHHCTVSYILIRNETAAHTDGFLARMQAITEERDALRADRDRLAKALLEAEGD